MDEAEENKTFMVRFRDLILRVILRIGKFITCSKVSIKSSCCDHINNTTNTTNTTIISNNNTPENGVRRIDHSQSDPSIHKPPKNNNIVS